MSLRDQSADWSWQSPPPVIANQCRSTGVAIPRSVAGSSVYGGTVALPRLGVLPRRTWCGYLGGLPRRLRLLAMTALFLVVARRRSDVVRMPWGIATSASPPRNDSVISGRCSEGVGRGAGALPGLHWVQGNVGLPRRASLPRPPVIARPVRRLVVAIPRSVAGSSVFGGRLRCRGWGVAASDVVRLPRGIATSASPPRNDSAYSGRCSEGVGRGADASGDCHVGFASSQ